MDCALTLWEETPGGETPCGDIEHIKAHDLTTDVVDHVLENFASKSFSRSSGCPCDFGFTPDDRFIIVVYEEHGDVVYPKTAYEVPVR